VRKRGQGVTNIGTRSLAVGGGCRWALLLLLSGCHGIGSDAAERSAAVAGFADVLGSVDTLRIDVVLVPPKSQEESVRLRGLSLSVQHLRVEPPALWPDGTPMSDYAVMGGEPAALVRVLARDGFFERAAKYSSVRRPDLAKDVPPPPGSSVHPPPHATRPQVTVILGINDSVWYTSYLARYPWEAATFRLLRTLQRELGGEAADLLDRAIRQVPAGENAIE